MLQLHGSVRYRRVSHALLYVYISTSFCSRPIPVFRQFVFDRAQSIAPIQARPWLSLVGLSLHCARVFRHYICPCSSWIGVEYPGCVESHEYVIRLSPVDFVVEFIEQETGSLCWRRMSYAALRGVVPSTCMPLSRSSAVLVIVTKGTYVSLSVFFFVTSRGSERLAVREIHGAYNSLWACIILSFIAPLGSMGFLESTVAFSSVDRSLPSWIESRVHLCCCL